MTEKPWGGGLPPQTALMTGRAVFTEAYAVIPRGCQTDIVTSFLPGWTGMRMWLLARPMSGFSETFSHYLVELEAGGGSDAPEVDTAAQSILYVVDGTLSLTVGGATHAMAAGGYAYVPAGSDWSLTTDKGARFHWIRKRWIGAPGIEKPTPLVTNEAEVVPTPMPDTEGRWATTRFVDPADLRHDCHVTIVTFEPGGLIPFEETHVMEHGLFVLEGKAAYRLNRDWVEVEAGDYMWLRAFCPQACYAGGPGRFRYLLYKDVNRHAALGGVLGQR
ncbi:(S)-ureidoglycine aminohydrolase [Jannaschia faecimaris]|uniref:(S)-ureidoglycine aminohydrolase n=1 Tax=Jannaschia faecimaris TaxID=1244108 RepID=A0A1H3QU05_9RHOB|nr:bifunctional allantoicase/(S)-ureidoglycine aminohydrolase [Jannaschia faecimaris]SDZ17072.1 (S)-ureidoglycine aminohydrolase [Jannaschia faecimaris]